MVEHKYDPTKWNEMKGPVVGGRDTYQSKSWNPTKKKWGAYTEKGPAPGPMAEDRIDKGNHEQRRYMVAIEAHTLSNGARDDGRRCRAEGQLKNEEGRFPGIVMAKRGEKAVAADPTAEVGPEHKTETN